MNDIAPIPTPAVVRVAVPPLPGEVEDLPAPVVVRLAVPLLPRRTEPSIFVQDAEPPQTAPREEPAGVGWQPDAERLRGRAVDWWSWAQQHPRAQNVASWARENGPLASSLLGLSLLLIVGWLADAEYGYAVWLHWLAMLGGGAWGWYWWRSRSVTLRLLTICGGVVLFRWVANYAFELHSYYYGREQDIPYFIAWCGLVLLGLWKGCGALARRFAPTRVGTTGMAQPQASELVSSSEAIAPSVFERVTSHRVEVEGVSASGVQRIRVVSTAERIKTIYWTLRLISFFISITLIAFYHDSIFHWMGEQLARNSRPMAEGFFSHMWRQLWGR